MTAKENQWATVMITASLMGLMGGKGANASNPCNVKPNFWSAWRERFCLYTNIQSTINTTITSVFTSTETADLFTQYNATQRVILRDVKCGGDLIIDQVIRTMWKINNIADQKATNAILDKVNAKLTNDIEQSISIMSEALGGLGNYPKDADATTELVTDVVTRLSNTITNQVVARLQFIAEGTQDIIIDSSTFGGNCTIKQANIADITISQSVSQALDNASDNEVTAELNNDVTQKTKSTELGFGGVALIVLAIALIALMIFAGMKAFGHKGQQQIVIPSPISK